MLRKFIQITLFIICMILINGCFPNHEMIEETETSNLVVIEETEYVEWPDTPTVSFSPTETPTIQITQISATMPEPTSVISTTPIPTLSFQESENIIKQWLLGNDDCRLPCWAGIIPGVTTLEEAKAIVEPVLEITREIQDSPCFGGSCSKIFWKFPSQDVTGPVNGSILELNQDFVTKLRIRIFSQEFQIPIDQFFTIYGLPEKILVYAGYFDEYWGDTPDEIILYYPEYDFVVRYYRSGWQSGGNRWSCGSFEVSELMITYNMETNLNNHDILVLLEGEKDYYVTYPDLDEVTDFSIESFAEMFIDDPNACFEILTNY